MPSYSNKQDVILQRKTQPWKNSHAVVVGVTQVPDSDLNRLSYLSVPITLSLFSGSRLKISNVTNSDGIICRKFLKGTLFVLKSRASNFITVAVS